MKHLALEGILAIGLLRGMLYHMNIGPKSNKMVYVYTNPSDDTEVFSCDRVFVLSPKILSGATVTNGKNKEASGLIKVCFAVNICSFSLTFL